MRLKILLIILISICLSGTCSLSELNEKQSNENKASQLKVTYIANEGFLISSANKKVLIDALFGSGYSHYLTPSEEIHKKMVNAQPPFNDVDLVLVTHRHADHFDAISVGRHLEMNPNAALVCPQQVIDELEKRYLNFEEIRQQLKEATPDLKSSIELTVNGINIKTLRLRHGIGHKVKIQNLGYLVDLKGKKFIHIGDIDEPEIDYLKPYKWLANEETDVAFLPVWFFRDSVGIQFTNEFIKPKHIVLMHITPNDLYKESKAVESYK